MSNKHDNKISRDAREELERFSPNNYAFRGGTRGPLPEADMELANIAIGKGGLPGSAAEALLSQARYQIALRKMLSEANPVTDSPTSGADVWGHHNVPSKHVAMEVDRLWENYRENALAYALDMNSPWLIAAFQPLPPMDDVEKDEPNCGWLMHSRLYGHIKLRPKSQAQNREQDSEVSSVGERPIQRAAAQNAAILATLVRNGFDRLKLPKNVPGKSGVKAQIKTELVRNPLFVGKVFDKAWERLAAQKEIAYKK